MPGCVQCGLNLAKLQIIVDTLELVWRVTNSRVSTMICNLTKFRPHCTQPGPGPPTSLSGSGFSGIHQSVILVHMRFIRTSSQKLASQSSSLEWCNTFFFLVHSFLTTYVGTPSATRVTDTASQHTHQWCKSGCVPDELGTSGQWLVGASN